MSQVSRDSAAHFAGVREDDEIVAIDGERVDGWQELKSAIEARPGDGEHHRRARGRPGQARRDARRARGQGLPRGLAHLAVRVGGCARGGTAGVRVGQGRHRRHLRLAHPLVLPVGRFRLQPELHRRRRRSPVLAKTSSARSLVGIVDQGSQIVGSDIWALLWLLGGISLILALFNLIPLLPFDGGHAAIVVYEWAASKIKGRKVEADYKKLMPVAAIVLAFFLTLSLSAMFLDVRQVIGQ